MKATKHLAAIIFCSCFLTAFNSIAQIKPEAFKKKLALPAAGLRMDSLIKYLSDQTKIEFSFNSNKISSSQKIALPSKQPDLEQVLQYLRRTLGIQHKLVGNHIILIDTPKKTSSAAASRPASHEKKPSNSGIKPNEAEILKPPTAGLNVQPSFALDSSVRVATNTASYFAKDIAVTPAAMNSTNNAEQRGSIQADAAEMHRRPTATPTFSSQPANGKTKSASSDQASGIPLFADLGVRGLGVSYEQRIGQQYAIVISTGLGGGYFLTGYYFKYVFKPTNAAAYVWVNPRYYFKNRAEDNTNTAGEGFYVGAAVKYTTRGLFTKKDYDTTKQLVAFKGYTAVTLLFNIHGGIQKPFGNRWLVNGHLGLGYGFSAKHALNHWYPAFDARIAYRLIK